MSAEKLFERRPFVRGGVIQQNDDRARQMAQQFTQKYADFILPDVVVEEQIVQSKTMPSGAYRDSRNDGDLVPPAPGGGGEWEFCPCGAQVLTTLGIS